MGMTSTAMILLSPERLTFWHDRIKKSRAKRKEMATKHGWDDNLERYEPAPPQPAGGFAVNLGVDFADVEQKKAALLFDTPSVSLTNAPKGLERPVSIHQELLNALLGPEHADVQPTALKAIFDCLCPSGIGPVLIGYHATMQDIETEVDAPAMDPLTQQPMQDQYGAPVMEKQKQTVPVAIHEKWFVTKISAKALLMPHELKDTAFQKSAGWMGYDWQKPLSQLRREYHLPPDWTAGGELEDKPFFEHKGDTPEDVAGDPLVSGSTLWYRAALEPSKDGQVVHPERIRVLTLVDGKEPLEHRDSPDQTFDAEGRLTADSVKGFHVRPLVVRDLSDSAWVASDCAHTASLTKEQERYRENSLRKRDTNVNAIAYETRAGMQEAVEKAQKDNHGGVLWIPVPEGTLAEGSPVMVQMAQATQGRETYQDQDLIRSDRARILAMDSNQMGQNTNKKTTATETQTVQRNTDSRFEQERQRVLKWYLHDIVKPFDALVLRYCDQRMATLVLGPEKAQTWMQFKPVLAGGYRYTLQMDSGKYLDVEADRKQMLNVINFAAKSPYVNQSFLWVKFAEKFGYDPKDFIVQPEPAKPEPPKVQFSVSATDDLNPASPQYANVVAVLTALGMQVQFAPPIAVDPIQAIAQAAASAKGAGKTPEHGGGADKAERIDQHSLDITGELPGMGSVS